MDWQPFFTRKFVAATLTAALMFIAWVLCQWLTSAREYLPTLITGLGAALTAFTAGNVAQDHVLKLKTDGNVKDTVKDKESRE